VAAGYPLFSGVIGVGDWVNVIEGWQPVWVWRLLLAVIGFILYGWGVCSSAFAWMSQMLQTKWFPEVSDKFVVIERNWTWVILAVVLAIFHIFVLGPGVEF
jgi:hypothetical protein